MNSQQLLYINLGIGLFFVLYFLFFRSKPKPPVRLHLRGKPSEERQLDLIESERQEREAAKANVVQQVLAAKPVEEPRALERPEPPPPVLKENSIYFVYNGHEWECHDVLGIPRGSSLKDATEKYQHLIKTSDPSTFPFYEAAFDAVLKRRGAR